MMRPCCISKLKNVGKILKPPETMRYSWWILDNILHQLRLYKLIMQITGLRTSHSCFHHPSPWDPTNFQPEFLKNRGTNHHFPKTGESSSTNQVSNTPEENMQCHHEHGIPYTLNHPEISDGIPFYMIFDDLWRVLIFLPPKRPWSTGHPLRRSTELSPTDREKNILGEGTS